MQKRSDTPTSSSPGDYLPEVEGLRAIAILAVLFFHFDLGVGGGFVGVDVFFVISGFLLGRIVILEVQSKTFKFGTFFQRRVRRLFPAFFVTALVTSGAAIYILLPADLVDYGRSLIAQNFFLANFYYWRTTGYFESIAEVRPMLHTWSLAVEEQFYLLLPFFLTLIARTRLNRVVWISLLLVVSFAVSVDQVTRHPTAAFYLLPTRAWELGLGVLIAAISTNLHSKKSIRLGILLTNLGLGCIIMGCLVINRQTPFPGTYALFPCIGAALIISVVSCSPQIDSLSARVLRSRPLVWVGAISYSLYLWHWPTWVFLNYYSFEPLPLLSRLGALACVFVVSWLTWRFVETPWRKKSGTQIWVMGMVGSAVLVGIALTSIIDHGLSGRFTAQALGFAASESEIGYRHNSDTPEIEARKFFRLGPPTAPESEYFIWGDSHAMALIPAFEAIAEKHHLLISAALRSSSPPILNYEADGTGGGYTRAVLNEITQRPYKNVILIGMWNAYLSNNDETNLQEDLTKTIQQLIDVGSKVWIVAQVPDQSFQVPRRLAHEVCIGGSPDKLGLPIAEYLSSKQWRFFDGLTVPFQLIRKFDPLLDLDMSICLAARDGKSLYRDSHHLSEYGATLLIPSIETIFADRLPR